MLVYEAVGESLRRIGVRHTFGLMGRANMAILQDLMHRRGVAYVAARHETSAVVMADAYARSTGLLGVASVSLGPAVSNTLTGILEGARGRTPLLLVAGDSQAGHGDYGQFLDQERLFRAVGVRWRRLDDPVRAGRDVLAAAEQAWCHRRPVVLSVPLDIQFSTADELPPSPGLPSRPARPAATSEVGAAADAVVRCHRPVVVAGRGAMDARVPLVALAERTGALLTTTLHADGLFAGQPNNLGVVGVHGSARSFELLARADLVMAFGASLDRYNTCAGHLYPTVTEVVHCDDDPAVTATAPVTVRLTGDAGMSATALVAELADRGYRGAGYRVGGGWPTLKPPGGVRPAPVSPFGICASGEVADDHGDRVHREPRRLLATLDSWLPSSRAVVQESGYACGDAVEMLSVTAARARVSTIDFEAIGLGAASAIGTAVGRPDSITVLVVGDGGLLMALGELETMVRYRLPILVVVMNNHAYGAEAREMEIRGLPIDDAIFPPTDFASVAAALGARAATVRRTADLLPVRDWIDDPVGPFALDCRIDPANAAGWFRAAIGYPDGYLRRPRPQWAPRSRPPGRTRDAANDEKARYRHDEERPST